MASIEQYESKTYLFASCRWKEGLLQDWVDNRINVLIKVLKQEGEPILDGQFQLLEEVGVVEGLHLQAHETQVTYEAQGTDTVTSGCATIPSGLTPGLFQGDISGEADG